MQRHVPAAFDRALFGAELGLEPPAFVGAEPRGRRRSIGERQQDHWREQNRRQRFEQEHPLPAGEAPETIELEERA